MEVPQFFYIAPILSHILDINEVCTCGTACFLGPKGLWIPSTIWACKWRHPTVNFSTNASGATWWSNFDPIQVVPPNCQIFNY